MILFEQLKILFSFECDIVFGFGLSSVLVLNLRRAFVWWEVASREVASMDVFMRGVFVLVRSGQHLFQPPLTGLP